MSGWWKHHPLTLFSVHILELLVVVASPTIWAAMRARTLQLMKTRLAILKLIVGGCSAFASMAVFGQTTYTWTGAADGTNLATAGNYTTNGTTPAVTVPNGTYGDTLQFDNRTNVDVVASYTSAGWPGTGFGTLGVNLVLTTNQTNSVQIISSTFQSPNMAINNITINGPGGAFKLGGGDGTREFVIIARPAGVVHDWINNSANPAVIAPNVGFQAGGGATYVIVFDGTGGWRVTNTLANANNTGTLLAKAGSGTWYWNGPSTPGLPLGGGSPINSPMTLDGGSVVLQWNNTKINNIAIQNNGTLLEYDAPTNQTLNGIISGTAPLQVNNGTLTLSNPWSDFTGDILLSGGELIVSGPENPGVSGPLGVTNTISFNGGTLGFSVDNVFDYSSRFSTAAGQAYSIDTGGQAVTFTNAAGLGGTGTTLTKLGDGTLTLACTSSYSDLTTVSGGRLVFQGSKTGSGGITVADGAALGIIESSTQVTPGTLTLGTSTGATLEFNNVTNTTTAPLAAGTLSSTGTVTININSGTFVIGQCYPLLSWTSGSAPAVSLGSVPGTTGFLSTNGNTIQFCATALTPVWTGANSGNWSDPGNWTTYFDFAPVLFDDTASGATSVTVDLPVHPAGVTVNNSAKTYSIASSGGNNIAGGSGLTKGGSGTLTLSGGANTYLGITTISGGTVSVSTLTNGSSASDIGSASSAAATLVLNGGALQYTGGAVSINRLFTLGTSGGTIDASGSGALDLNNTGSIAYSGTGARMLTLTGTYTGANTLAAVLADNGGATALTKKGAGTWVLSATNGYSGETTIAAGTLQIGTGGASGSPGSGNITNNGALIFNRTGTLTVSGTVSGNGSVAKDGNGTVILAANNSYAGGTTINAGTMQVGNGGATGQLNGAGPIVDNGTLIFNSTGAFSLAGYNAVISGTGNLIKRGSGVLKIIGNNTYTGWTTIDAGATLQVCEGNQGQLLSLVITNNGTLKLDRQDFGVFGYSNNIVGAGRVVKDVNNTNPGDVTLAGTNTYAGGTIIAGGGIILGDGVTPGAGTISGNVVFTNSAAMFDAFRWLAFNHPEDFIFSGDIVGAVTGSSAINSGAVYQSGAGTVTLTGNNTYPGGTFIFSSKLQVGDGGTSGSIGTGPVFFDLGGVLIFNRADSFTFSGDILQEGSVVKIGAGTLTLSGYNGYTGTTTVSNGTMIINGENTAAATFVYGSLGGIGTLSGPVTLASETTLAPGASVGSVGTLTINNDLAIGGNLAIEVNKSLSPSNDLVLVSGVLTNTGTGTLTVSNLGPALAVGDKFTLFSQHVQNGAALTVTGAGATWANNLAVDGSITVTAVSRPTLTCTQAGNRLQFSWNTSFGSFRLQAQTNSLSTGLGTNWVDYPGGGTSPVTVPMDATKATVFFRLVSP